VYSRQGAPPSLLGAVERRIRVQPADIGDTVKATKTTAQFARPGVEEPAVSGDQPDAAAWRDDVGGLLQVCVEQVGPGVRGDDRLIVDPIFGGQVGQPPAGRVRGDHVEHAGRDGGQQVVAVLHDRQRGSLGGRTRPAPPGEVVADGAAGIRDGPRIELVPPDPPRGVLRVIARQVQPTQRRDQEPAVARAWIQQSVTLGRPVHPVEQRFDLG
jgi:hypothetical protein